MSKFESPPKRRGWREIRERQAAEQPFLVEFRLESDFAFAIAFYTFLEYLSHLSWHGTISDPVLRHLFRPLQRRFAPIFEHIAVLPSRYRHGAQYDSLARYLLEENLITAAETPSTLVWLPLHAARAVPSEMQKCLNLEWVQNVARFCYSLWSCDTYLSVLHQPKQWRGMPSALMYHHVAAPLCWILQLACDTIPQRICHFVEQTRPWSEVVRVYLASVFALPMADLVLEYAG